MWEVIRQQRTNSSMHIIYILRESSDLEDFEKIKIFAFLMLFCNQNDLSAKIWVLAKLVDENIFYGRNRKTPS